MTTNPPKLPQADQAQVSRAEKFFKWLIILLTTIAGCLQNLMREFNEPPIVKLSSCAVVNNSLSDLLRV
ncbi:hypothetical protein [Shewanella putrefaciens]|uniref:hypothetical protein n=1 Tax=Shewanella putrefaciens TaxID=24 RepID=UPI002862AE95|nr:hypothetical protein [Shewanella putrefaciens]MDR6962513.1 hypothetical protein [Shewanella putrefaciens]